MKTLITRIVSILSVFALCVSVSPSFASIPRTVKVSDNDSTAGYLNGKLIEGDGINFTENNDGEDETLSIAVGDVPSSSINWSSLNSVINSSGINWSNVNLLQPIKAGGINWNSLSSTIQRSGVNWSSVLSSDIPNPLNQNTTGNAATATSLAANGTNCSAGQYPLGVDAQGNAESCTTASGGGTVTDVTGTAPITSTGGTTPNIGFNWSSVSSAINSSAVNWSNINSLSPIKVDGINWSSITDFANGYVLQGVTGGGVKFASPSSASVNWSDIIHGEIQSAGVNWSSVGANTITAAQASLGNVSNVNWQSTSQITPYVNWSAASNVLLRSQNWDSLTGLTSAGVNWLSPTTILQKNQNWSGMTGITGAGVNWTSVSLVTPALGTPVSGVLTNCTGTASGLTAGTVTTNANLTGPVTSSGNATSIAANGIQRAGINWSSLSSDISSAGMNWANIGNLQADYGLTGISTSGVNWTPRKVSISIPLSGPNAITGNDKMIVFHNDSGYTMTIDKILGEASASSNWSLFKVPAGANFNWGTGINGLAINWDSITVLQALQASTADNGATSGINWNHFATTSPTVSTVENNAHIGVNWQAGTPNWATTKIEGHYN